MEIKWIEDFVALAENQSFSRAAEARNVTQSGFSRRIQALEQWVGADLVDRSGYPPTLTPAGKLFKEFADEILLKTYDMRAVIRKEQRLPGVALQIAAGHSIALNFLPEWLAARSPRLRQLRTSVVPTNVHDSVLMLANGNCDLMFAYHHPELALMLDPARYEHLTVGFDTLMPFARCGADGLPVHMVPATAGQRSPLLAYGASSYFGRCLAHLLQAAPHPLQFERRYESDMAELLKKMARAGEGIAWLPQSAVVDELRRGELARAGGAEWAIHLEIHAYRAAAASGAMLQEVWEDIRRSSAELLG